MKTEIQQIRETLVGMLTAQVPPLKVRTNSPGNFEVAGTKETMQGKQKVDGFYFASVVPKPTDVRLYFFPIYTNPQAYNGLSAELSKCLKGKSCFHIKKLSPAMEQEIQDMVTKGVSLYKAEGLI